ncbi:DUF3987 domain-containing protein [Methylobacterium sp. WCS2018Hpa-22]|uniref:DUF3987 domain-containing protein n=1 Tax=Methylobacterium sp. WCS2018Hpa-22 TaxID=3073633 RepID=UPI00288C1539|nr:DUF3987 domain-containing protein [Methylobacterium sp. WCS2018Hpa-22]
MIAEALRPLGYKAEATFEFDGVVRDSASQSTDFFRRLNDDALANLDAWVPKLALPRLIRQSGGGWRGVPFWRPSSTGTPTNKRKLNLSFDPKGIRDFGDGGRAYTPLNVVLAACDLSEGQIDTAAKWLGEWIGYDFSVKIDLVPGANAPSRLASEPPAAETVEVPQSVAEISEPAPEPVSPPRPTLVGGNLAAMMADIPEDDDEDDVFEPAAAPEASGPATADWRLERYRKLEALTHVPGLVGQMIDWIVNCSEKPSRVLALGAALTAVGALAGRWYDSPTHLRTNLYIANLAASGFGKDHARKCILALFHEHGMDRLLGGSKIMSGSALRKQVEQSPSTFYLLDEFGSMLRDIYDRRAGTHTKQIRDYLLEFYSSASTYFNGADYAGEKGTKIYNPNVAVYGTSTPIDFWSSMSSGGVADGFLARMIVMSVDGPRPRSSKPPSKMLPVPRPIVDMCHEIMTPKGGNLSGATHDGTTKIEPVNIPFVGEAEALWYALCNECDDEADVAPPELHPIYNRLAENAQKLATVLAIGMNPTAPVIDCDTLEWGFELAWLCAEGAMDEVQGRLADNERQREYLDVKRHIQLAGPEGITKTKLTRLVNGRVDTRRFDDILTMLGNANDIEIKLWQSPKGGPPGARFVFKPEAPRRRKVS